MSKGVVWITGASSGMGQAVALEMAAGGWRVGMGARRLERLQELLASLPGEGPHGCAGLDVRDGGSVARWAASLRERPGEPDVVVNAAGWGVFAEARATSEKDWDQTLDTNLKGLFLVTREVLPAMLARGSGQIVNILSVASRVAFPKNTAYNASKYGALGFTDALRAEVRPSGVRVTAVLPGATDTPFWDRVDGEWDRTRMLPPKAVARAVRECIEAGPDAMVEELRIAPQLGNL